MYMSYLVITMCSCVGSKVYDTSISLMGSVMDLFPIQNGVLIVNSESHWHYKVCTYLRAWTLRYIAAKSCTKLKNRLHIVLNIYHCLNPKSCRKGGLRQDIGQEIAYHFSQDHIMATKFLDFIHIHPK